MHIYENVKKKKKKLKNNLPQAIKDVVDFVSSSDLEKFYHLLTSGSSTVNGCRQNESPNTW